MNDRPKESVWDYPRPPRAEETSRHIRIIFNSKVIAETKQAIRVLETSHPPVYYIPQADIAMEYLQPAGGGSFCEWKGGATYWTVTVGDRKAERVGWSYPTPVEQFAILKDFIAFYTAPMDECTVDGEAVKPQPGGFYGGWITSKLEGPFKGGPGTMGW